MLQGIFLEPAEIVVDCLEGCGLRFASMATLGKRNLLSIVRESEPGLYLDAGELGEILLPGRYIPPNLAQGDKLDVFIYRDSKDRLVATTDIPFAMVGEFAYLKVLSINQQIGVFLDWGLPKDLLLPFREHSEPLRVGDRVESMAVMIATGVNLQGRRDVLGFDVMPSETEEGWQTFLKNLKERGLHGVQLVISDAHAGLKAAARKVLKAEWQRCKVHFYRNVLVHVPKRSQSEVSEAMKAVFVQRDEKSAQAKAAEVVRLFQGRLAKAMEVFESGIDDVLSYLHYPPAHRTRSRQRSRWNV